MTHPDADLLAGQIRQEWPHLVVAAVPCPYSSRSPDEWIVEIGERRYLHHREDWEFFKVLYPSETDVPRAWLHFDLEASS